MTESVVTAITSRDNPGYKDLRRLAQDGTAYRRLGQVWLEGEHLCHAVLARGLVPQSAVFAQSYWARAGHAWTGCAPRILVLADTLFAGLSSLESPAPLGFVMPLAPAPALDPDAPTVVLDRLQDAGNVGAILRCAAAFGFVQVIGIKGSAGLWSPKVLRAGMGAHYGLRLIEGVEPGALDALRVPLLATSSHQGEFLHQARLPWPCAWAFGHEGQGISPALEGRARAQVRIAQPGGEESLNVAAAAAICLHASAAGRASA